MASIKLFRISDGIVEIGPKAIIIEEGMQSIIEENMPTIFGARFLTNEYQAPYGNIDSLALDENNCPILFVYKKNENENVMNKALYYLDWLVEHKVKFEQLVNDKLGAKICDKVDWSMPGVMCIADSFSKYDEHVVDKYKKNLRLIECRNYGEDLLMLEFINVPKAEPISDDSREILASLQGGDKTFNQQYSEAFVELQNLYDNLESYALSMGEDVFENKLMYHVAFKKVKNFVSMQVLKSSVLLHFNLSPDKFELEKGMLKDVRGVEHHGSGDLRMIVNNEGDLPLAKELIALSYREG